MCVCVCARYALRLVVTAGCVVQWNRPVRDRPGVRCRDTTTRRLFASDREKACTPGTGGLFDLLGC